MMENNLEINNTYAGLEISLRSDNDLSFTLILTHVNDRFPEKNQTLKSLRFCLLQVKCVLMSVSGVEHIIKVNKSSLVN